MSDKHEAMKRRYAALMLAELAWRDDLASEGAEGQTGSLLQSTDGVKALVCA